MKIENNLSTEKKLVEMLSKVWADYHFLNGMMMILKTDEQKQKMINILKKGETDTDQLILLALEINKGNI